MKHSKGFTLIELLVVISIIGVLSSVVLAAVSTARAKGQVAAGQTFAGHTYTVFGIDALGYWNFDEGGTLAPLDSSGNNQNFTQTVNHSTDVPNGHGYSADFTTVASTLDYNIPTRPQLPAAGFSYGAWIKPTSFSVAQTVFGVSDSGNGGAFPGIMYISTAGQVDCRGQGLWSFSGALNLNQWNYVLCSYNGTTFRTYINGSLTSVDANNLFTENACFNYCYTDIFIGKGYGTTGYTGLIDEVALYSHPLSLNEVKEIYAKGLPAHLFAMSK